MRWTLIKNKASIDRLEVIGLHMEKDKWTNSSELSKNQGMLSDLARRNAQ